MSPGNQKQMVKGVELYNSPIEATAILDRNGIILWATPSIFELLGFEASELEGTEIFRLLYWSSTQKVKFLFQEFQHHNQMMNEGLKQFRNKKGKRVALHVSLVNLLTHPAINGIILNLRHFKSDEKTNNSSSRQLEAEIEKEFYKKVIQEIAAELHDNIGSTLIGAKLILEHSLKNPIKHFGELEEVLKLLNVLVKDVRNLSHGITNEDPKGFVLYDRLCILLENFRKKEALRILLKYDFRLEELLQYEQKIQIFRILQEQVSNIVKHAAATKAIISLQLVDGIVKITTRDNGNGFNVGIRPTGIGLSNMLFRVDKLGGHLQINSQPGAGTTIWVVFYTN